MDTLSYKTQSINKESSDKKWVIVDASDQTLGRLASKLAYVLRGKHRPTFTPHSDTGDNVVVINAEKVKLSGNKLDEKVYIRHTGFPGGIREINARNLMEKDARQLIEKSVKGMLPKNKLGRVLLGNMYVYVGSEHGHQGQKPENLDISKIKA